MKKWFLFEKQRFFKFQVDSYFGKGGGLKYFQLEGTRSGVDVIIKQMIIFVLADVPISSKIDLQGSTCYESTRYDNNWGCANAFEGSYTIEWATRGEGVGNWISIVMPR